MKRTADPLFDYQWNNPNGRGSLRLGKCAVRLLLGMVSVAVLALLAVFGKLDSGTLTQLLKQALGF